MNDDGKDFMMLNYLSFLFLLIINLCPPAQALSKDQLFSFHCESSLSISRIVLIIPGKMQKTSDEAYHKVGNYYVSKGITPVFIDINWEDVGLNDIAIAASQVSKEIMNIYPDKHIYLFGFSFGAAIAYKISESIHPDHVVLCSMSPVFEEDRPYHIFPFRQIIGILSDYPSNQLSYNHNEGKCFVFLYGNHDSFLLNKSIIENRKSVFSCNKTIIVKDAGHKLEASYLEAIKAVVSEIP
jgi:hypothetical protein